MASAPKPDSAPESSHLVAIRRVQRLLEKERSAHSYLETLETEHRQFRTMQSANRVNVQECQARRASEEVKAGITLWYDSLIDNSNKGE
jgi:hypothetical protein